MERIGADVRGGKQTRCMQNTYIGSSFSASRQLGPAGATTGLFLRARCHTLSAQFHATLPVRALAFADRIAS
jgi:hypothetical protein